MAYNPMNFPVFMGQIHENATKIFIDFQRYFMGLSYLSKLVMYVATYKIAKNQLYNGASWFSIH